MRELEPFNIPPVDNTQAALFMRRLATHTGSCCRSAPTLFCGLVRLQTNSLWSRFLGGMSSAKVTSSAAVR